MLYYSSSESLKFMNNLRITQDSNFIKTFLYSGCYAVCILTFVLSMQYLLFCSLLLCFTIKVRHQQRCEFTPLIFNQGCTFGIYK